MTISSVGLFESWCRSLAVMKVLPSQSNDMQPQNTCANTRRARPALAQSSCLTSTCACEQPGGRKKASAKSKKKKHSSRSKSKQVCSPCDYPTLRGPVSILTVGARFLLFAGATAHGTGVAAKHKSPDTALFQAYLKA